MNRIDPNDPRLTAYALGELDEAEQTEFEQLLQDSEEDRELVAEFKNLAEVLSRELASEPHPVLTPAQRGVIERHLANSNGKTISGPSFWTWFFQPYRLAGALAVCLVIGVGYLFLQSDAPVPLDQAKSVTMDRLEVAKGISKDVEKLKTISYLRGEQSQEAEKEIIGGIQSTTQPILTDYVAGRPMHDQAGDLVVSAPMNGPVAPSVPPAEAVQVVVADGEMAGKAKVEVAAAPAPPTQIERLSVVEPLAPAPQPASSAPVQPEPVTLAKAVEIQEGSKKVAAEPVLPQVPPPPPAIPASSAPASSIGDKPALTDLSAAVQVVSGAGGGMHAGNGFGGISAGQVVEGRKVVSTSVPSRSSGWAYKGSALSEEKIAARKGSDMAPSGGPVDKDEDSWDDLSTHSFSGRGTDLYDQQSPSREDSERRFASTRGFSGQQPVPTIVANANGGMGGGAMFGMGMMGGAVQQQVAAGSGPQGGPAEAGYFALAPSSCPAPQKPEVIVPTESEGVETYAGVVDNPFKSAADEPLSTFSIDVDTASYSNLRRYLNQGSLPPKDAVRIEEMLNYFPYDYAPPTGEEPFATHAEISECPWNSPHRLVRIGIKGKVPPGGDRPACNLVFLIDVSGSMQPENKLPLLKKAMTLLLNQLQPTDQVAIVTYASTTGLVLPSTPCSNKPAIQAAIDNLQSGGSTNGEGGIQLAYKTAEQTLLKNGINRVILATDGDFNVGVSDPVVLQKIITDKAKGGVFLSVLGFGMGNLKDATLETLADKGNGNYAYIDTLQEARKVLVEQMSGTLMTIAKDVKIQIEFNPGRVGAYRLIGYENRVMAAQDFNDDRKDAGEIGAGHTVTALYEVVPVGTPINMAGVDSLKYQKPAAQPAMTNVDSPELLTVKLRYKAPDGDTSKLIQVPVTDPGPRLDGVTPDFKFAAAVASFGMLLRESPYRGSATFDSVHALAQEGKGGDKEGYRTEFIQLVGLAKALKP